LSQNGGFTLFIDARWIDRLIVKLRYKTLSKETCNEEYRKKGDGCPKGGFMRLNDTNTTLCADASTRAAVALIPKHHLPPVGPPVKIPPNEPKKPPVEEPGDPYEKPPIPEIPPVEEPWDVPHEPPVKEPPPEDPDQIPPQPHISGRVHHRRETITACTP
jgi:hypothetical protein